MSHTLRSTLADHVLYPAAAALCSLLGTAQTAPLSFHEVGLGIDSGLVRNSATDPVLAGSPAVVWSTVVHVPGAPWVRLRYDGVKLAGASEPGGDGSFLRLTALADGAVQTQHGLHVRQWRHSSAYLNGSAVLVELWAFPGTGGNRLVIRSADVGDPVPGVDTICGPTDDRTLSTDRRAARNQPTGCTSWMIDDCQHCFLTAGHCQAGVQVLQFNVPLSSAGGSLQHPPPSDQYAVDAASMQGNGGLGIGDDWAYFGVFPNSTTGLTPYEAQGRQAFVLASVPPPVQSQSIRVTGYGTVSAPVSATWTQVQKTHTGPYYSFTGTTVRYTTDTTGGNSGSPIIDDSTGMAIGIHTHGGCDPANHGTGSNHSQLQLAIASPRGVCACPGLAFSYPNGLPARVDPAGGTTIRVAVGPAGTNTPLRGSGVLHVDVGAGFATVPMTEVAPNVYDAVMPASACRSRPRFYFSAQAAGGARHTDPRPAPETAYSAFAAGQLVTLVAHDFNSAPAGWTVADTSVTDGSWVRAVPAGNNGTRGDPPADHDGSGTCWVTGNGSNQDVDGGPTAIQSSVYDLSVARDPHVRYARWMTNDDRDDLFTAQISQDGGTSWSTLESVGHTTGWVERSFRIRDFATALDRIRFRFAVADQPNDSVTEGGLDAFGIEDVVCWPATWETYGAGCAGSAGLPNLQQAPGSLPVAGRTFDTVVTNVPATAPVFGLLGFSSTSFPPFALPLELAVVGMPGCQLLTDIQLATALTNSGGTAPWALSLPAQASVLGLRFYQQAFVVDAGVNALGATTSNGGQGRVGQ
jgi:hypothetical protein